MSKAAPAAALGVQRREEGRAGGNSTQCTGGEVKIGAALALQAIAMGRAPSCAGGIVRKGGSMDPATSALLTDLYQLNMLQAYLDRGETKSASFEFFVRKLPSQRGFLIAAGLEQVLEFLSHLRFASEEL